MAEHDVLAEHDVWAARSQEQRVQQLPQSEAKRAGTRLGEGHDELVLQQRAEVGPSDDELDVFGAARPLNREQLLLRLANFAAVSHVRATHAVGTNQACA